MSPPHDQQMSSTSRIVSSNDPHAMKSCALHLKNGKLVAFPTETVYGLGGHALDENAVLSIFKAKGRPLTDPVIVHVLGVDDALKLVDFGSKDDEHEQTKAEEKNETTVASCDLQRDLFLHLASQFWPGPLTIVVRANQDNVPSCVTAGTGFVGIRSPNHPIARRLLEESQLPIAAPSANRFGHVSPTKASHVMEDLGNIDGFEILVLDGGDDVCEVGIESTVMKIEMVDNGVTITVLRRGGVSIEQLQQSVKFFINTRNLSENSVTVCTAQSTRKVRNDTTHGQQAPGQMITHYAPDIPAYIYTPPTSSPPSSFDEREKLKDCVVIDFGGALAWCNGSPPSVKHYVDLSPEGNVGEAASRLFETLRQCEKVEGARAILLPNLTQVKLEHADALFDRIFRAASGRYATITEGRDEIVFSSRIVADKEDAHATSQDGSEHT